MDSPGTAVKPAFCPKCNGEMGTMDIACPQCGYDFQPNRLIRRPGFAHSRFAEFALVMGALAAGVGIVFIAAASVTSILRGNVSGGLIAGPLLIFFLLASMVVFLRMQD